MRLLAGFGFNSLLLNLFCFCCNDVAAPAAEKREMYSLWVGIREKEKEKKQKKNEIA